MYTRALSKRIISMFLCIALLLTLMPTAVFAADGETIKGDPQTSQVTNSKQSSRETNFNDGWKFYLGTSSTAQNPSFDDSGWSSVTLPHDFSISQSYTTSGEAESGFLPGGTGWYRKTFTMPAADAGKTVLLNFDGVYSDAYVYVNGTQVGENHYGYTAFAFDITDYLTCDGVTENVIAVKAVNTVPSSRWYSGSGIYRDVTLMVMDPVHVDLNGTYVTTPDIASGTGTVNVETTVVNDSDSAVSVTVKNTVYDRDNNAVASAQSTITVNANSSADTTSAPVVSEPNLWSTDSPYLYTVRTEIYSATSESNTSSFSVWSSTRAASSNTTAVALDTYETTFGFRYFSFDSTGFHLNGQNVKLNGVCMHHDQGALGSAAYYDAMYRQLSMMKDMGANAIRTSHNPADEDFIDICNQLGLLVIEEAFDGWSVSKNGNSYDFARYFNTNISSSNGIYGGNSSMTWAEYAIKSMVKRDRNDPAVILWSLGNEIQEGASADSSFPTIAQNLINWVNEVDGTRPTTIGDNTKSTSTSSVLGQVLNVITNNGGIAGFNYANSASTLNSLAQTYGGVVIASETSSATNSRGQYQNQNNNSNSDGKYHLTSYDTSSVSWGITAHDSIYNTYQHDCVAGEFVWTGFDYLGEPTPWNGTGSGSVSGSGAIPNSSYFGIVETTGFEKDTYYLYRSQWNQDETTLHLVTAWDSDNYMTTSSKTPVVIYSNAPVVKLYRNGTLIGTATRTEHTSSAGHTYYTYSTTSNSSVCTAVSGSGSTSLYATFNVTYASGTISAKAYEADGATEIALTGNSGKNSVSTPGTVSKLSVTQNKTEIAADGSSLVYIAVDVQDANGVLDTTATNTINFSLTGNGEIVGVDNGDQATTAKYQQSSVLTSSTSAKIAAYAGKALVIVRSTKDAGSFTVNVTSSGLTGGSATVSTTEVGGGEQTEGLASYTMVRDYTVKAGTVPELETTATGTMVDGTEVTGTIAWDEIPESTYSTAGDYTINGTLTFEGEEPIGVIARLHVIADVIALRNISTATTPGNVPTLPSTVSGVMADGTLSGEFTVTWESMSADQFTTVGDTVTVDGTATVFGSTTLPVTASIRVAEAVNTESTNVAASASLTQDIEENNQSDNLSSITDGVTTNYSDTNARWTNYNNRNTSSTAAITFTWATAQLISSVNLYYFTDNYSASLPSAVQFEYSLNGTDFTEITYADVTPSGGFTKTEYVFDSVINPVALRITLTEQSGRCVGLTEAEVMTYAGKLEYNSSADLASISVDGTPIEGFDANTLTYEAAGETVLVSTDVNAGITPLPVYNGVIRFLTISEDGTATKTYAVTLTNVEACDHANTEVRNAVEATCTAEGYTGDTYCTDCGQLIASGETVSSLGHDFSQKLQVVAPTCTEQGYTIYQCSRCEETEIRDYVNATGHLHTEVQNAKAGTCTENGYTGDTVCTDCGTILEYGQVIVAKGEHGETEVRDVREATCTESGYTGTTYCVDCGAVISYGTTTPMLGHSWNEGVVTKEPADGEDGEITYTCTHCGETKVEYFSGKTAPQVTVSAARSTTSGKIALTGTFVDYANIDNYYDVTAHGLVYYSTSKLGTRTLTVNTAGRTRVNFSSYSSTGTFTYNMKPAYASTRYTVRAFLAYTDDSGKTVYVYSAPIVVSYNELTQ